MTAQELIDELNKVQDKSKEIYVEVEIEQSPKLTISHISDCSISAGEFGFVRINVNEPEDDNY